MHYDTEYQPTTDQSLFNIVLRFPPHLAAMVRLKRRCSVSGDDTQFYVRV